MENLEQEAVAFSINNKTLLLADDTDTLVRLLTDEEYIMNYITTMTMSGDLKNHGILPNMVSTLNIILLNDNEQKKYAPRALAASKIKNNNVVSNTSLNAVENSDYENSEPSCSDLRSPWTRNEILKFIAIYEENQEMYKSTTTRKDQFWQMAAKKLNSGKTATQCQNKFKYLTQMYKKKKDNMSSKKTGEAKVHFPYFEEMDAIFGKDHNIVPVAVASSSNNDFPAESNDKKSNEPTPKKVKLNKDITNILMEREKNTERRHQENLKKKNEALELCKELVQLAKGVTKK